MRAGASLRIVVVASIACVAASCTEDVAVVQVHVIDRGLPSAVRSVVLHVFRRTDGGMAAVADVPAPQSNGIVSLPWISRVQSPHPADDGIALYRIRASAMLVDGGTVSQQGSVTFLRGVIQRLDLKLFGACVNLTCPETQRCTEGGGCVDDVVDPCITAPDRCDAGEPPPPDDASDLGGDAGDASPADVATIDAAARDAADDDAGPPPPPPLRCDDAFDCGECTIRSICGWCEETRRCSRGTASGSDEEPCTTWRWYSTDCPGPIEDAGPEASIDDDAATADAGDAPCPYGDCAACVTGEAYCGWCRSDMRCRPGSQLGPDEGACESWQWFPVECE